VKNENRMRTLESAAIADLLEELRRRGYELLGPTVRDGAIVYDEIASPDDLPVGLTDEQGAGRYRLRERDDGAYFGYVVGPHSWKKVFSPPVRRLWIAEREGNGFRTRIEEPDPRPVALIGVRACELAAMAIQDRVCLEGPFQDPFHRAQGERVFTVAVNCTEPGGTCFCTSMETGPEAAAGFDLVLTEIVEGDSHVFLAEAGSDAGGDLLDALPSRPAIEDEVCGCRLLLERAAGRMGRSMETAGLETILPHNDEHRRWDETAERCLACANCTMVCPTCFCHTVEDVTDLTGGTAERVRVWDSCFTADFSYIHGGSVRQTRRARYRQWLTHKLATWHEQFGTSGCVGCGRCITWCPVGIDITEEARAIRETDPFRDRNAREEAV
jgi:Fe-S-cluster-containing hydrogenase component 2